MTSEPCPCCSGKNYDDCCQPAHLNKTAAQTCEALMRSRYSAYVLHLTEYLINTTHPNSRTKGLERNIRCSFDSTEWLGLTIKNTQNGNEDDKVGKVEFIAEFTENGKRGALHELSRFSRYQGNWVYIDGTLY